MTSFNLMRYVFFVASISDLALATLEDPLLNFQCQVTECDCPVAAQAEYIAFLLFSIDAFLFGVFMAVSYMSHKKVIDKISNSCTEWWDKRVDAARSRQARRPVQATKRN